MSGTTSPGDAFLFAGQGAQYVGMGSALADSEPEVAALFAQADEVLGVPLSEIMRRGPAQTLTLTENTQPAILTLAVAHARLAARAGVTPRVLLGHSLGEYAAWVVAGSLSFEDALRLVRLRGQAMQEAVPVGVGAMVAVISTPASEIEALCAEIAAQTGEVVSVSVLNCPGNTVVSGHAGAVSALGDRVEREGLGAVVRLEVSAPFHCALLEPAARRLEEAMADVRFSPNEVAVIPNVSGEVMAPGGDPAAIRQGLIAQVVSPVLWEASLRAALASGVTRMVSMGPGAAARSHMKRVKRRFPVVVLDEAKGLSEVLGEGRES